MSIGDKSQEEIMSMLDNAQLPPELEQQISMLRSQFQSQMGLMYEDTIKGFKLIIKALILETDKIVKENDELKAKLKSYTNPVKPKNRKQRRAEKRNQNKLDKVLLT